ncbi:MAG TPA: PAS domain S-box protein [Pyrinomonadaceae bacterium]|jgi:PAS domain S-box-containing protein
MVKDKNQGDQRQRDPPGAEEMFRLMVESVKDYAVFAMERDGTVISWNIGAEHIFGYTETEIIGRNASVLFTPEDIEHSAPESELETAEREGRAEDERRHVRRDGSRFWASGVTTPLRDNAGHIRGFVKVARDNTRRRLHEEALRISETLSGALIEQSPFSIQILSPDGHTLRVNHAWEELWGVTLEQIADYNMLEDQQLVARGVMPYIKRGFAGEAVAIPPILYDPNETIPAGSSRTEPRRWVRAFIYPVKDEAGRVREVVLMHEDITEHKRAEDALRESEESHRVIAETASDAIITIDEESTILFVNAAAEQVFGYSPEEMIGQQLTLLMPEYMRHLHRAGMIRYIETGKRHISWKAVELPGLHKGGQEISLELSFGEYTRDGKHIFTGIARDITERKRLEGERHQLHQREQAARREAEEASRLKDEFLATVSHELRTPLTAVLGWAHILRAGQLDGQSAQHALETIERNARSQAQLIDDLLDVSRIITGKLRLDVRPVDPASFIEAAIEAVRPAAEAKGVRIQKVMDTGVSSIAGDPARLQQVVWNLVSNAIKFTPKGGRVQVRLERVNSHIEIAVSDSGQGIAPEFLPYVFDRFRQADGTTTRAHGGLGLGLSIVRHLVELHGGNVHVESQGAGRGATFTVRLPLLTVYQKEGGQERVHPAARDAPTVFDCLERLDGLQVLVVDDEADTRELLKVSLGRCGATVTTASSAEEAFDLLTHQRPDVLISDIGMPGADGYDFIKKVRSLSAERGGKIPAIALTAYARAEDRLQVLRAGYQMHVAKPVELTELVAIVANLAGWNGRA